MQQFAVLEDLAARFDLLYQSDATGSYVYSRDMVYRYAFARSWSEQGKVILWIGVNPAKGTLNGGGGQLWKGVLRGRKPGVRVG